MKKLLSLFLLSALLGACGSSSTDTVDTTPTTDSLDFTYKPTQQSSIFDDLNATEETQSVKATNSFFNPARIKSQSFELDPTKPNTITGENGISVYIPANSFTDKNGTLVTNKISFELKEVITKKDMIMSGLCTVTDKGEILESGGMFFTSATSNGKPIIIADNVVLDVTVPTAELKEGMMAWDGVEVDGQMVWKNPRDLEDANLVDFVLKPDVSSNCDIDPITDKIKAIYVRGGCIVPTVMSIDKFEYLTYPEMDKVLCGVYPLTNFVDAIDTRIKNGFSPNKAEGFGKWKKSAAGRQSVKVPRDFVMKYEFDRLSYDDQQEWLAKNDLGYKLSLKELGACNIDRLATKAPGITIKKGSLVATTNRIDGIASFQIFMVLKNRNVYLGGMIAGGTLKTPTYRFGSLGDRINLPVGEEAIICALATDGVSHYFAAVEFTMSTDNNYHLTLEKKDNVDSIIDQLIKN